jgi:hypothetical protein
MPPTATNWPMAASVQHFIQDRPHRPGLRRATRCRVRPAQRRGGHISPPGRQDRSPAAVREVEESFASTFVEAAFKVSPDLVRHAAEATGGYPFLNQLVRYFLWKEAENNQGNLTPETVERAIEAANRRNVRTVIQAALATASPKDLDILHAWPRMTDLLLPETSADVWEPGQISWLPLETTGGRPHRIHRPRKGRLRNPAYANTFGHKPDPDGWRGRAPDKRSVIGVLKWPGEWPVDRETTAVDCQGSWPIDTTVGHSCQEDGQHGLCPTGRDHHHVSGGLHGSLDSTCIPPSYEFSPLRLSTSSSTGRSPTARRTCLCTHAPSNDGSTLTCGHAWNGSDQPRKAIGSSMASSSP